jgi:hypothetical protein
VNFRSPGGDKHPSLDPIQNGQFEASRLRLCLDIAGAPAGAKILSEADRVAIDLGGTKVWLQVRDAAFGSHTPSLSAARESDHLMVSFDLIKSEQPVTVRWADLPKAFIRFALIMEGGGGTLDAFDQRCRKQADSAELAITGSETVGPIAELDRAFSASVNGKPVPEVRLSDEKLV